MKKQTIMSYIQSTSQLLYSACKKTRSLIRKLHFHGLQSQKKRSLICVNEYFSGKRNEENGVFLQRLYSLFTLRFISSAIHILKMPFTHSNNPTIQQSNNPTIQQSNIETIKHSNILAYTAFLFLLLTSTHTIQAQNAAVSLSELKFEASADSALTSGNVRITFSFKITHSDQAASIKLELAEVMHNFTLYTLNGTFSTENGLSSIELGGNKQAFNEPWGTISFELPANLVKQWKFTRISVEQLSGATTKFLYHRW